MNEVTIASINEESMNDVTDVSEARESEANEGLADTVTESMADTKSADTADTPCEEAVTKSLEESPADTCEEEGEQPLAEASGIPSFEELHAELARLRAELEETKSLHARMAAELGEFQTLFPEVSVSTLPESIWEQVKNGIPLAASYALYEKKCILQREHATKINLRNAKKASGAAGKDTAAEYFSPDEVRAMSQSEVRNNYQKILESMKKWNS